jgi:hypothetical protein
MNARCCFIFCIAALPILAACDNSQKADSDSFERALQSYYDAHPICTAIPLTFPIPVDGLGAVTTKRQMEPLVKVGLVTTDSSGYSLTLAGEKVIHKSADKFLGGTHVCFAKRKVVKIETFTAPADAMGRKISSVTYDYALKDVEAWATDPKMAEVFPQIGSTLAKPGDRVTDILVLTTDGWKHEHDIR